MFRITNLLLQTLIFSTIIHWRAFDATIVLALLFLIALRPFSKSQISDGFQKTKLFHVFILAWIIVVFIGNFHYGTPEEVLNFRWILGCYIIYAICRLTPVNDHSTLSFPTIVLTAAVWSAIYFYKVTMGWPSHTNRFAGFYDNPNVYGMTLSLPFAFLVGWILTAIFFNKKVTLESLGALLSLTATVLLTYSRSSWLGIIAATMVGVLLLRQNKKIVLGFALAVVLGLGMFFANFMNLKERIVYSGNLTGPTATTIRLEIWKANIAMFLDYPLFGVGYWHNTQLLSKYTTPEKVPGDDIIAHAHNQYLQVLAGTGITGFLTYMAIISLILTYFYRQYRRSSDIVIKRFALCALLTLVSYLFTSLTDSPLDSRETRDFLMIILAGSLGVIHTRETVNLSKN